MPFLMSPPSSVLHSSLTFSPSAASFVKNFGEILYIICYWRVGENERKKARKQGPTRREDAYLLEAKWGEWCYLMGTLGGWIFTTILGRRWC